MRRFSVSSVDLLSYEAKLTPQEPSGIALFQNLTA